MARAERASANPAPPEAPGRAELSAAGCAGRGLLVQAALFGIFVNLLMLTGPLYMLQVYDRVLAAHSEETLVALSLLVAFLYIMMGILDHARARLAARAGARLHDRLGARVFGAALTRLVGAPGDGPAQAAGSDLDSLRLLMSAPVLMALFDMPWAPLFLGAIFVFHPALGCAALAGGGALVALAVLNQVVTRTPRAKAAEAVGRAARLADALKAEAETVQALGMRRAGLFRWQHAQTEARDAGLVLADRHAGFAAATRVARLFLQSAMLGFGAWLVLRHEMTAGAMVATSVMLGRALAPVELVIAQWTTLQRAAEGWRRLSRLLSETPADPAPMPLPAPRAALEVDQLTLFPPEGRTAVLRMVSFRLSPGQALGVIGPSGAGKSTLARALTGLWPPAAGTIRLGDAPLEMYAPDMVGRHIGYLPQRVSLFDGTVAENIARLDPAPDSEAVIAAARAAGAHEMILSLPGGYDTEVGPRGGQLSGGQVQRIALARALYGDPALLILDEPNSNLDNAGSVALNAAIRCAKAAGRTVLVMAHRPAAIEECDLLLALDGGRLRAFGPRDQVLRELVRNHAEIRTASGPGGVA